MKLLYTSRKAPVKAGYTIRMYGRVWHIRATHLEVLNFIRLLGASRSAA